MPETSLVITAYQRSGLLRNTLDTLSRQLYRDFELIIVEDGNDGGEVECIAAAAGARFFRRARRPDVPVSNPAIPINIGIRRAEGQVVVLQNAECRYTSPLDLGRMVELQRENSKRVVMASIRALNEDGSVWGWYLHPSENRRTGFFCAAFSHTALCEVGGFDESFHGYAFEDDDLGFRLGCAGAEFLWCEDVIVEHQWHPANRAFGVEANQKRFERAKRDILAGRRSWRANEGREWGRLEA